MSWFQNQMELRAFVRSLFVQTFSRYGWAYWRFLVKGFFARPLMVPETVTLTVKGHHYFKITRGLLELRSPWPSDPRP